MDGWKVGWVGWMDRRMKEGKVEEGGGEGGGVDGGWIAV